MTEMMADHILQIFHRQLTIRLPESNHTHTPTSGPKASESAFAEVQPA